MNKDRGQIRKKEENYRKKKKKKRNDATLPARRFRQTSDRFHGPWIGEEKRGFLKGIRGTGIYFIALAGRPVSCLFPRDFINLTDL